MPHSDRTGTLEGVVIGKPLNPRALTDRQIPKGVVPEAYHGFTAAYPVDTSLDRLGGQVEEATGVTRVGPGARDRDVIRDCRALACLDCPWQLGRLTQHVPHR